MCFAALGKGAHETGASAGCVTGIFRGSRALIHKCKSKRSRRGGFFCFFFCLKERERARVRERDTIKAAHSLAGKWRLPTAQCLNSAARPAAVISTTSYHKQVVFQPVPARSGRGDTQLSPASFTQSFHRGPVAACSGVQLMPRWRRGGENDWDPPSHSILVRSMWRIVPQCTTTAKKTKIKALEVEKSTEHWTPNDWIRCDLCGYVDLLV